jgi:hypothetical protein
MHVHIDTEPNTGAVASHSLLRTRLRDIAGIHPVIDELFKELKIPPLRCAPRRARQDPAMRALLSNGVVDLVRDGNKLHVIGNIRFFLAMRLVLDPNNEVLGIERTSTSPDAIRQAALREFLYLPAVSGIHFSEVKILAKAAACAMEQQLWTTPSGSLANYLAALYDVDSRPLSEYLRKHPVTAPSLPANSDDVTRGAGPPSAPPEPTTSSPAV